MEERICQIKRENLPCKFKYCNSSKMADGADGKLRFSRKYFLVFERKQVIQTLEMKIKFAKEHSTTYKVGGLEWRKLVSCTNSTFLSRQTWKQ